MNISLYSNRILRPIAVKKKEDIFDSISITGMRASGGPGNISQPGPPSPPAPEDSQYPLTFGADLALWLNGRSYTNKTTSDIFQSVVTGLTSDDTNAHVFTVPTPNKIKFSGNWFYLPTAQNISIVNAEKTPYRFLHDGSDFEIWGDIYIKSDDVTTTSLWTIAGNSDSTSGKTGFTLNFDNRSANSHSLALNFQTAKSQAGTFVINTFAENAITLNTWNRFRVKRTGTNITIHVETVQISSANNSSAPITGTDPSDNLTLFSASTTASRYFRGLKRHIIVIKRNLTADEVTNMYAYLDEGDKTIGGGDDAYIFGTAGQSNALGNLETGGAPPSYLEAPVGAFIYEPSSAVFAELDYPTNQQGNQANDFAAELEFGYRMNLVKPSQVFIIKKGVSGTALFYAGSDGTSWNIAAGTTNGLIHVYIRQWLEALRILKFQLNRTAHILGFEWRQGEADSSAGNPYEGGGASAVQAGYKDDLSDMFKKWLDDLIAAGHDTSKCRLYVAQIDNAFSPSRAYRDEIVAASLDVCQNMRTEDPTYATKCLDGVAFSTASYTLHDGTHFNDNAQVSHGFDWYTNALPHIND